MSWYLAAIALLAGFALSATAALAQPQIPATFYGSVTIEGQAAPDGSEVRAIVNGHDCSQPAPGERPILRDGDTSAYVLSVVHESQRAGCAQAGSPVTFTINGRAAVQSSPWNPGPIHLDLSVGAAPPIPLPSPTGTVAAAVETAAGGAATAPSANPTLNRPTGTPPTDDVKFDQTPQPSRTANNNEAATKDSGGPSVVLIATIALLVLAAAGGAAGFALSRRAGRRPPPSA